MISASLVKELRETSGAGMMDCKKALEETNGDMRAALDYLREKGFATANKKSGRIAAEGLADIFVDGNKAVIVEVNSETDFVSKNPEFKEMITMIGDSILKSEALTLDEALELPCESGIINDLIVAKTAKIGEKLSLRRFEVLTKSDEQNFGVYSHNGGKIAVLSIISGGDAEIAKDISMQSAAMRPLYVLQ